MTPSEGFAQRIAEACKMIGTSERALSRRAGIKSESQIAAARSRGSKLNWDHVAALVRVLGTEGISRSWLLWGEEPKLSRPELRVGPGAASVPAEAKIEIAPVKKGRNERSDLTSDAPGRPRNDRRKAKRLRA